MQNKTRHATIAIVTSILTTVAVFMLFSPSTTEYVRVESEPEPEPYPVISHTQDTWMRALEWCESRGNPEAINPEDLDGTPSYSSWQFKPSTLDYYAEKYSIATTTVMDRNVQEKVLTQMILHRDEIRWDRQFPACVRRPGPPPA